MAADTGRVVFVAMRIAMLSPPWIAVPPEGYGGIEWVVSLLTEELVRRGHDVTLFATGDSRTSADLRYVFERGPVEQMHQAMPYAQHVGAALRHVLDEGRAGRPYDVVHDHCAWMTLAFGPMAGVPVVHTLHGAALDHERAFLSSVANNATFVAISTYQTTSFSLPIAAVVPNAVDVDSYTFRERKDGYLLSLGRIARDKAQGLAIEVARRAGMPIILAGKVDPGDDRAYFDEAVAPHVDGVNVIFEGEVRDDRKRELYAGADALLFPIQWEEPFGLVMVEAMASGTPVIATPRGSVPEVVADGVSGFIVPDVPAMVDAVRRLGTLSAKACRAHVEGKYSAAAMADGYEAVYRDAVSS